MTKIWCYLLTGLFSIVAYSQNTINMGYPVIGRPCPDFTLTDLQYTNKSTLSLIDLKGINVILDFWSQGCISCVRAFPKINSIQKKFKDDLQIVLIGPNDVEYNSNIKIFYEKFRAKHGLNLAVAYDSSLCGPPFKMMPGMPWYVWIDRNGIVKAITGPTEVNVENVEAFIKGQNFDFLDMSYDAQQRQLSSYDSEKPLLIDNNRGIDSQFLFRSLLSAWKPGMPTWGSVDVDHFLTQGKQAKPMYEAICSSLKELFIVAYTGYRTLPMDFYPEPIIGDSRQSSLFEPNFANGNGLYNYSLIVPKEKAGKEYLMNIMRNDLRSYFGLSAHVIEKEMPCLYLRVIDVYKFSKLKSKPNVDKLESYAKSDKVALFNINIHAVADVLRGYAGKDSFLNIFNETNYQGNIDLSIDSIMTTLPEVNKELARYGLFIIKGTRKQKVLEIIPGK